MKNKIENIKESYFVCAGNSKCVDAGAAATVVEFSNSVSLITAFITWLSSTYKSSLNIECQYSVAEMLSNLQETGSYTGLFFCC